MMDATVRFTSGRTKQIIALALFICLVILKNYFQVREKGIVNSEGSDSIARRLILTLVNTTEKSSDIEPNDDTIAPNNNTVDLNDKIIEPGISFTARDRTRLNSLRIFQNVDQGV